MGRLVILVVHALQRAIDPVGFGGVQSGNTEDRGKGLGSQIDTYLRLSYDFC